MLFSSDAKNLVDGFTGAATPNIFLRDRTNGVTTLISIATTGDNGGNLPSAEAVPSADWNQIAFASHASDLVSGDTNGASDVFVRNRAAAQTRLVSLDRSGTGPGNGDSYFPAISPDGRWVAFASAADNLVEGDTNGIPDIFLRDIQNGVTTLVSVGGMAQIVAGGLVVDVPVLTPDARIVAFSSVGTNYVPGATNRSGDVYVRDVAGGSTIWASEKAKQLLQSVSSTVVGYAAYDPHLSEDGAYLMFSVAGNEGTSLVVRLTLATGELEIAGAHTDASYSPAIAIDDLSMTPDGRYAAWIMRPGIPGGGNVYRWDAVTKSSLLVSALPGDGISTNGLCHTPRISRDGRYVSFVSNIPELILTGGDGSFHAYVRDIEAGATQLATVLPNGEPATEVDALSAEISDDGRFVVFDSFDAGLVPGDQNQSLDVLLSDLLQGSVALVSEIHPGLSSLTANGTSGLADQPSSADGNWVVFTSLASDLAPGDDNGLEDVYARDRRAGTNALVSVGLDGRSGRGGVSSQAVISAGGRYVAFTSTATNLVSGDTNNAGDVFVRDLQLGRTILASRTPEGNAGSGASSGSSISGDGRRVIFQSKATNLAPGNPGGNENLYLFDTSSETVTLVSVNTNGVGANNSSSFPKISRDGRWVAFWSTATDLVSDTTNTMYARTYVRDLQSGTTRRVAVSNGATFAISSDGTHIGAWGESLVVEDLAGTNRRELFLNPGNSRISIGRVQVSDDGRWAAYSIKLLPGQSGWLSLENVYLADMITRGIRLVSVNQLGTMAGNGDSAFPSISPDGRFVAYRSFASDLDSGDSNQLPDVFVYDRQTGVNRLVSRSSGGASGAGGSVSPLFTEDGNALLFVSSAPDLIARDHNQRLDVFRAPIVREASVDVDDDGLPDAWEILEFGNLGHDGIDDTDGDGAADWAEYLAGTSPKDPESYLHLEAELVPGGVELEWFATVRAAYQIEFRDDAPGSTWKVLERVAILFGNKATVTDDTVAQEGLVRWWRVRLLE